MNNKKGLSVIGYAICLVIILGLVMIISAPMMVNRVENNVRKEEILPVQTPAEEVPDNYVMAEIRSVESSLSSRISYLERRQSENNSSVSDKFVCSIEGTANDNGDVIPLSGRGNIDIKSQKIVFVCEYRQ